MKFSDIILGTIFTVAIIIQIIIMFLFFNELDLLILVIIGYIIWVFSLYFGFISLRVFKKKGEVEKGKSYINTTKLVDSGPYSLVRHPQYLGGILFTISITLWSQILISLILSIVIIILIYQWTYMEDKSLIDQFKDEYKEYKKKVPRLNPIVGIIKLIYRKRVQT